MRRLLIFSTMLTLLGVQVACNRSENQGMNDIQKEEEMDRSEIMERDTYSDDKGLQEVRDEDVIINDEQPRN